MLAGGVALDRSADELLRLAESERAGRELVEAAFVMGAGLLAILELVVGEPLVSGGVRRRVPPHRRDAERWLRRVA